MPKKTTINLEIIMPTTSDIFSASIPCSGDPQESALDAQTALAYVADKARRSLGFLTEDQLMQQREHLEALAASMRGAEQSNGGLEAESDAVPMLTHAQFCQALENLLTDMRISGVEDSMPYRLDSALDIVRAEFVRVLAETEGESEIEQAGEDLESKFGILQPDTEFYGGPRLAAETVRFTLHKAAGFHGSGSFPVDGVVETVRAELNRQVEAGNVVTDNEAEGGPVPEDAPALDGAFDVPAEDKE